MNYQFAVAGIGFCVGNIADYEDLIEAVITGKQPAKRKIAPTARYAVAEAMKYADGKPVLVLSNGAVPADCMKEFPIGGQQTASTFAQMMAAAAGSDYENILLLAQTAEGYAAALLTREAHKCFAQAEIETGTAAEMPLMDAMMAFLTAVVEIRYAFKLDGSVKNGSYVWHWAEKRAMERLIDGVTIRLKEAEQAPCAMHSSKRYILPVQFDTIEEAEKNLRGLLDDAARLGLYGAQSRRIAALNKRAEHIIVLLADGRASLKRQVRELLEKGTQLLDDGFRWQSREGSLYIRRTAKAPKVVFMNPPGGMFNSKPFRRYVAKLYDFITGPFVSDRKIFTGGSTNETLDRYLEEVSITYAVIYLLKAIGISPDFLSGASMGEVVFDLSNSVSGSGDFHETVDFDRAMDSLEASIRTVLDGRKAHELAYFGHEIDLTKYYLKCEAAAVWKATEKYSDVFVIIEGSPKDVLICGERTSCASLIRELGCVAIELDDPMYVHTPVVESQFEVIRRELTEAGICLDVDRLPYKLFSTYLKKSMDSSVSMFAENFAAIVTRPVVYTGAVKALYEQDARVFIDLSTTQLCGNWAKNTLSDCPDAQVVSIYEEKETAEYLLDLAAVMLAGNVAFDFEKIYSRLSFVDDTPAPPVQAKNEVKPMVIPHAAPKAAAADTLMQQYIANQMVLNQRAYEMYLDAENKLFGQLLAAGAAAKAPAAPAPVAPARKNYLWDRQQVITMTDTSMAAVLGEKYKEVDQYPIRARMPLPPFLFVSRIVSIDAEFGVMRPSSIVAEYDMDEDCVFRMGDSQVSPLIGAEASHIAIFLIAYMGLDAISKGTLSYRAIDSSQVSYSERPFRVGDTMRTVLKINRFVQNGATTLLFFTFETWNGDELIAITEATGGFFTKADLTSNKGIIAPKKQLLKKTEPKEFLHFSNAVRTSYEKEQLEAFYRGDHEGCFGDIQKPSLKETYYLPHDLKMVDRVTKIDYNGGMYGRGLICGEKQLTPDMWPFKAHFKNDPVFPAIIMTDAVTQLAVFLFTHAGLLSRFEKTNVTMINGNCVKSMFRGQARHGYSTLSYEVHVKEVIEAEDCISVYFDAGIFNDGLQIIQVESYALKIFNDPN